MNQLDNMLNVAIQDALRNNIANIYKTDREGFNKIAKDYTNKYA